MKVLHICSTYIDRPFYKTMFDSLSKQGVDNIVYVPRWSDKKTDDNVLVISRKFNKFEKLLYWGEQRYIYNDIVSRIAVDNIDCVHVHRILYGGYAALKIKEKYGIPYIVTFQNSDIYGMFRNVGVYRNHCLEIMSKAEKVIFFSNTYQQHVIAKYKDENIKSFIKANSDILTLGINSVFLNNINKPKLRNSEDKKLKILCVAEIDENKNSSTLIKACKELYRRGYNVSLSLLGKIKNEKVYENAVSNGFVMYLGVKPIEEVVEVMRKSDVFVMPSIHESFGLVYAEAMTQGIPVVYTRGQGFDGQFNDGEVGYAVNCFDYKEIADKVELILSDYNNISARCIERSQRYSWDNINKIYKEIYDQSMSKSRY